MKAAAVTGLLAALALSLGLSACDPAPLAELRNNSGQTVILRSVTIIHAGVFESGPHQNATIAPNKAVRFLPWEPIKLRTGQCELTYAVPELPGSVGIVFPFELRPDQRLYLRALKGRDLDYYPIALDVQPPGWPLSPAENSCRQSGPAG